MIAGKSIATRSLAPRSVAVDRPPSRRAPGRRSPRREPARTARPRPASAFGRRLVFALSLIASAFAGAAITLLLWIENPRPASLDAFLLDRYEAAWRSAVAANPTPGAQAQPDAPRLHSSQTEPNSSEQANPQNEREIKTTTFSALGHQDVTASIGSDDVRSPDRAPTEALPAIKNWRYQLVGVDADAVAKSSADLVVIDYAGSNGPFTRAEVEQMRRKPDGSRRIVLAYISIGQAETFRWYWPQRSSAWIGSKQGRNYGVRFWHPGWQQLIFEYIDKIVDAGFDGAYLGHVDEFEEKGRKEEMVEFVARISARAKSTRADFLIVPQNGDALIAHARFRRAIDAFARQDLIYGASSESGRNAAASIREAVRRLKVIAAEGKPVLVVEYLREEEEQARLARREISENSFIGLIARRELDRL